MSIVFAISCGMKPRIHIGQVNVFNEKGHYIMMTSSNGNIFRVTGPLCGEFTGPGEFPAQWPVTRSFDVFFDLGLNKRLSKQPWGWWFETPPWSLWRQCKDDLFIETGLTCPITFVPREQYPSVVSTLVVPPLRWPKPTVAWSTPSEPLVSRTPGESSTTPVSPGQPCTNSSTKTIHDGHTSNLLSVRCDSKTESCHKAKFVVIGGTMVSFSIIATLVFFMGHRLIFKETEWSSMQLIYDLW